MEITRKSFRQDLMKQQRQAQDGVVLEYDDATEVVREYLKDKLQIEMEEQAKFQKEKKENVTKDKEYLRHKKEEYRNLITDCIYAKRVRVRNYEDNNISAFIEEMVEEFAGYSVLADAFNDPQVSDIFCIDWKTIFIERSGNNEKYEHTFRSPAHYERVVKRFIEEAGKTINMGEQKIVDFELFGDRGCATSPGVSPRDYSLTLRKHAEDHITKEQLVGWKVFDEKMADFLGMAIIGECNIIYAGLTGSGKTTTIRALLDHYVTKARKRMLVCEDTQELFPENEHTVELVSVKSDNKKAEVSLAQLIITALRLKPKYIVVGEVRGAEAEAAVEGMETGHSTIFTMHGGNPWNIVNRIVTKYLQAMPTLGIEVVERIIGSAVDYICIQDNIPGIGRKITSITEVGYDFINRTVICKTICRFDFKTKGWIWEGKIHPDKADKMMKRGVPIEEVEPWIDLEAC